MNYRREQKQLIASFEELVAPYVSSVERAQTLHAYLTHKDGRKFEAFISHGDLSKIFSMRESPIRIADDTPCLHGLLSWKKTSWAEARQDYLMGDSLLTIALDGSWLAICQEMGEMRLYLPDK